MKTDISRISFDELKHYLGVHLQMGRVQLDSDWNEQSELWLRLLQRVGNDTERTGSPNHGFRVDDRILFDAMDSRAPWQAEKADPGDPDPRTFVDYFDHRTGQGSFCVQGASALARKLQEPVDLRDLRGVVIAVKGLFAANECVFFLGEGGTRLLLTTTEDPAEVAGWRIFRADPATLAPAIDLAAVDEYGFTGLNKLQRYSFDYIKVDDPIRRVLVPTAYARAFEATPQSPTDVPKLAVNDDDRIWRSTVIEVAQAESVTYTFAAVRDLSHARRLILATRTDPAGPSPDVTVIDASVAANEVTLAVATSVTVDGWDVRSFDLPQGGVDWSQVNALRWDNLVPTTTYFLAPVLEELDLDGNLVIMGGDGTTEGAGRFYGDGLAAVKESHETYFSQRDLPAADATPLDPPGTDKTRIDLVCLDLWERPVTYMEDPDVREVALEGPDTCARTQLVAQVRILQGAEVNLAADPQPPLAEYEALPRCGRGTLTTKDKPEAVLDPCADPCEPEVAGTFVGEENRLYRVEVHEAGEIGAPADPATARFKWSRENAATGCPLIARAEAGGFSVKVEKPELFAEGDLIEVVDDLADLVSGPYTDLRQTRGELRRVVTINLEQKLVSWEDAGAVEPEFHTPLPRSYSLAYHAKVRRWDGVLPATAGDISLADGVVIELSGEDLIPGDHWLFTTRVVDRSVERLVEEPPRGTHHGYFKLATITRRNDGGQHSVVIDDCRPSFSPLTGLRATDVSFDPGRCLQREASWKDVGTVQEAIDAICRLDPGDVAQHNRLLHGYGVVCGLKVKCNMANREQVVVERGYALDCAGESIIVDSQQAHPLVADAEALGLLDNDGNGEVCLTISRGVATDALIEVEQHVPQDLWDRVLEGTLLKDFYEDCIKSLIDFFKNRFLPFPATAAPPPENHKRLISFVNLLWQLINPASGRNVFVSSDVAAGGAPDCGAPDTEHEFLRCFYDELRERIQSETFCAMFDNARQFPEYPFAVPPGIETAFGLIGWHTRLRVHPSGRYLYSCGAGKTIHVYDLDALEVVEALEFPTGESVEVQDVAFSETGDDLYAVGIVNDKDSIFAVATIAADQTHNWVSESVVCDSKFVTLATTSTFPGNLYAIGKAKGLFVFPDPHSIPSSPSVAVAFNATGMLALPEGGGLAFAAEKQEAAAGPWTETSSFDRVRQIDLGSLPPTPVPQPTPATVVYPVAGEDGQDDITSEGGVLYVTGDPAPGHTKSLWVFTVTTGALVTSVDLGVGTITRLASVPGTDFLLVSLAQENQAVRLERTTNTLDPGFRVPLQVIPVDITTTSHGGGIKVCALNWLGTVSVVDADTVIVPSGAVAPEYVVDPLSPPFDDPLGDYRQAILDAYEDVFKGFLQYLKDCFCDKFLVDCPQCGPDDKVYLGCVEIRERQVYNICNLTKRHYVKSFPTYGYWLSTLPILPLLKTAFAELCCLAIPIEP